MVLRIRNLLPILEVVLEQHVASADRYVYTTQHMQKTMEEEGGGGATLLKVYLGRWKRTYERMSLQEHHHSPSPSCIQYCLHF